MKRRWRPRVVQGGKPRRAPKRRRSQSWRDIRIMMLGGVTTGLAVVAVSRAGDATPPPSSLDRESPAFVRVIDGDTFDYRGETIRVADIDTPEREGRCPHETALAARATARMRVLIAAGPFALEPLPNGRDADRFGRSLRIVTRGGRSLGDQLVAEGLARTWSGRRQPWC